MIVLSYSNIDIIQGIIGYGNASEGITDWRISNTSNATFNIFNSSSELSRFSILDNGNVGIGTTPSSTSSLLEISGDVNISGIYKKNNIDIIQSSSNYVTTTSNFLVNRIVDEVRFGSNYVDRINNKLNTRINDTSNYILSTSNILVNLNNSKWTSTSSGIYYNQKILKNTLTATTLKTIRYMVFPYTTDYSNVAGVGIGQSLYTINIPTGGITCDILMVGGGGAGGKGIGPGGGGGAVLYGSNIYIPAGTSNIIVGRGAIPGEAKGKSTTGFNAIILGGGSAGNDNWSTATLANSGGSGAGGKSIAGTSQTPGAVIPSTKGNILTNATLFSGNIGGTGGTQNPSAPNQVQAAGGGGASTVGGNGGGAGNQTGNGGNGVLINITGNAYYWGGGGGGGSFNSTPTIGGLGGGGAGERRNGSADTPIYGTVDTSSYTTPVNINGGYGSGGGGGGTGYESQYAGYGGSGIIIIRYITDEPITLQNTISSTPIITPTTISGIISGTIGIYKYMIFTYTIETAGTGTGQSQYSINVQNDNTKYDILMVGGGGAGGKDIGGGGGGAAVLYGSNISIPKNTYILKVGRGAIPGEAIGKTTEGFGTIILGGGSANNLGWGSNTSVNGNSGGSGAGGKGVQFGNPAAIGGGTGVSTIGTILTSSTIYNGNIGGSGTILNATGSNVAGGGGGGAVISGYNANATTGRGGDGGDGVEINILGTSYWWGAGGGGATDSVSSTITCSNGGKGGGGAGGGTIGGQLGVKYMMFTYTTDTAGVGTGQTLYPIIIPSGGITCDILIVGGGGGGGAFAGGGGGAGGLIYLSNIYIASGSTINVKVGKGGIGGSVSAIATNGSSSSFGTTYTALGGGFGANMDGTPNSGGSGGGGSRVPGAVAGTGVAGQSGAAGTTGQGNSGGTGKNNSGSDTAGGGGGGAGAAGNSAFTTGRGADGGIGLAYSLTGNTIYYAGGGGGGSGSGLSTAGSGGLGGGGNGSIWANNGSDASPNTGGGGGGGSAYPGTGRSGGSGGSGIVIIRYYTIDNITLENPISSYPGITTGTIVRNNINGNVGTNGYGLASEKNAGSGTGSGGGGARATDTIGGNGGSGIIIIRYKNIESNVNVGIGTTNPQTELHVYDDTTNNTALTIQNNYNDPVVITPNTGYTITETIENNKYYRTLTFSHFPNYPSDPPNTSLLAWYRFNGDGLDYNNSPIKYDLSANTGPGPVYSSGTGVDSFFQGRRYINTATGSLKSTTLKLNSRTFSVSVWLRTKNSASFTSIGPFTTIVSNGTTTTTNVALWLGYKANNAYAIAYCNNDLYCGAGVTGSPTSYLTDLNTWVHIVYVVLANYNRRIYRNGILIATDSNTAASTGLGELSFGVDYNNNSSNINVDLSDLRVYNKGLAPPEVSTLYYSYSNLVITDDYTANFTNPTELSVNGTSKTASGLYNISIGNLNSSILPAMGQLDIPLASTAVTTVAIKYNYNQNMLPYIYYGPGVTSKNVGNLDAYTAFTYTGIPSQDPNTTYTFTTTESYLCDILIIGGGGAGGQFMGGGGGAGGVVYAINQILPASTYQIKVGRGGIGVSYSLQTGGISTSTQDGVESSLMNNNGSSYISFSLGGTLQEMRGYGGGGGGTYNAVAVVPGRSGGSGGGCSETNDNSYVLNAAGFATQGKTYWNGNEYVVGGKQGRQNTTTASDIQGGGGGGLGILSNDYRNGNNGVAIDITGTSQYYAAGGGAGQYGVAATPATTLAGLGGIGGGGNGRIFSNAANIYFLEPRNEATSGTNGTGSGGGGGAFVQAPTTGFAGSGGSGIVIIRYRKLTSASFELINNNIDNSEFVIPGTIIKNIYGTLYKYIIFPYTVDSVGLTGQTQYTFNINSELTCNILLVGGGGGGGGNAASGGGGDVIEINNLKLPIGIYTILVGRGGIGGGSGATINSTLGTNGISSRFSGVGISVIAEGGGGGWALWTGTNAGNLPTLSYFRHPITDVLTPTCGGVGGTGGDYNKNNPKSILYSPSGSGGTSDNAYVGGAGGGAAPSPLGDGGSSIRTAGGSGGKGISSSITGTSIEYGGGGGAGAWELSGRTPAGTASGGAGYQKDDGIFIDAEDGRGGGGSLCKDGGSGIVIIRYLRTSSLGNNYKIGNYNGEFKIISNNTEHMRITENGASIYNPTGSPLWSTVSDRRIKENIEKASYDKCYDNINKLELCRFNYIKELNNINKDHMQLGYIAQDVKDIFPKAVSAQPFINKSLSIPNLLSIDISQINYSLYGAVKKLIELDNNKEKRIKKMEDLLNISTSNICNLTHDILNTSNVSELSIDTSNISELSIDTSNISELSIDTSNVNDILLDTSNINSILLDTSNVSDLTNQ